MIFFFNGTGTAEIYTEGIVVSVRGVEETVMGDEVGGLTQIDRQH